MENNYKKLLFLVAYIVFASVSCWATAESLHMLLPSWPLVFCYAVTIGFFIIASIGTKLIADSFNSNVYVHNRGGKLAAGILIVAVFWLICSLPTNTHTFFYRSVASDVANDDISTTKGYLGQLVSNTTIEEQILKQQTTFDNEVKIKLAELEAEIMNDVNPGFGPKSKQILSDFAVLLNVPTVEPLSYKSTSEQQRKKLVGEYRKKIYALAEVRKDNIRSSMMAVNTKQFQKEALVSRKNIEEAENVLTKDISAINDIKFAHDLNHRLNNGYSTISNYEKFIVFKSHTDKERYTSASPVTKVKRLMSVFDVWGDFIKGNYKGHGFIFWILISLLVDVAAFIFFDLAFKKSE